MPETLRTLAEIGYQQVEPFGLLSHAQELAENLPSLQLSAPTAHAQLIDSDVVQTCAAAEQLGVSTVIEPKTDPARWATQESIEDTAKELKAAARIAAEYGLRIGYHNHAFEVQHTVKGKTALEVFADAVGNHVDLQLDTYWAAVGGVDSVALLKTLGEQVQAVHIKDGPVTEDKTQQVAVGAGRMPIADIISAAPQALPVVELDDFDGYVFNAVRESYRYLTCHTSLVDARP